MAERTEYIDHEITDVASPVLDVPDGERERTPEDRMALCLSGGGYRAMLFHLGAVWRLDELGLLRPLASVSSVSGGSITAAVLGFAWNQLDFDASGRADPRRFQRFVVDPIRSLAGTTIDLPAIITGALLPTVSAADRVEAAYRAHLFGDVSLQALPAEGEGPRFVINAANIQTGALFRFSRPYMADYRLGMIRDTSAMPLARAVAASSAFPPVLSPLRVKLDPSSFEPQAGSDVTDEAFRREVVLSDGGVYDNLGLQTAFPRYRTILASDAGEKLEAKADQHGDWARHGVRVALMLLAQVGALRKRQLIASYKRDDRERREGAYWGIRSDVAAYPLADAIAFDHARALELAATPTRLCELAAERQQALINWGYIICDTAIRAHVLPGAPRPAQLPYPT